MNLLVDENKIWIVHDHLKDGKYELKLLLKNKVVKSIEIHKIMNVSLKNNSFLFYAADLVGFLKVEVNF